MDAVPVVAGDPALGDVVDGRRVEVVQLLPAAADGRDEVGRLQHGEVLAHRLAGHVQPRAQLAQRLAVALVEAVEQDPAARVGQRLEHVVSANRQPFGCLYYAAVRLHVKGGGIPTHDGTRDVPKSRFVEALGLQARWEGTSVAAHEVQAMEVSLLALDEMTR